MGRFLVLERTLPGETDDVIAQELVFAADGGNAGDLFRVNTRTGRRTSIGFGKPDTGESESWVVDDPSASTIARVPMPPG